MFIIWHFDNNGISREYKADKYFDAMELFHNFCKVSNIVQVLEDRGGKELSLVMSYNSKMLD